MIFCWLKVQNRAAAACETAGILESVVARLLTSYYENTHRKVNAISWMTHDNTCVNTIIIIILMSRYKANKK